MVPVQTVVGFFPGITTRQRNYPQDFGMLDELGVEIVSLRECQFEHDQLACWQLNQLLKNSRLEQLLRFRLFRAVNVNLRLDDWHQSGGNDLRGDIKLLVHDVLNTGRVGLLDEDRKSVV